MRTAIHGPGTWLGTDIAEDPRWRIALPPELLAEAEAAAAALLERGLSWSQATPDAFPLPSAGAFVSRVREELEEGSGIVRIEGLDPTRYDEPTLRSLWFGLGAHLGTPLPQNWQGEMMRNIRDEGSQGAQQRGVGKDAKGGTFLSSAARTVGAGALRFHTDRCDVVGLLCIGQAAEGGLSRLASTAAVHNALLEQRPDLLEALYQPIPRSRFGEEPGGEAAYYLLPVFGVRDGRLTSHYSRTFIEYAQERPEAPRLTALQREAIEALDATQRALCYDMQLAPGDIQLVNNHTVYHARTAFADDPATGRVRSLLRLWLSMPNSRALPEDHAVLWQRVESGAIRGGIGRAAA